MGPLGRRSTGALPNGSTSGAGGGAAASCWFAADWTPTRPSSVGASRLRPRHSQSSRKRMTAMPKRTPNRSSWLKPRLTGAATAIAPSRGGPPLPPPPPARLRLTGGEGAGSAAGGSGVLSTAGGGGASSVSAAPVAPAPETRTSELDRPAGRDCAGVFVAGAAGSGGMSGTTWSGVRGDSICAGVLSPLGAGDRPNGL